MANFVAVVDPDPIRRAAYITEAAASVRILPGLRNAECGAGAFAAVWAAAQHAPVSMTADVDGAAVLLGDALTSTGARAAATDVCRSWKEVARRCPDPWDGFHAAVAYDAETGVVAGADLFGLFPVYYWSHGDVLLVGSSIAAFRGHPLFRAVFNPVGLIGILMTGGLFDGETLWRGVRRLSPGHLLAWSPRSGAREIRQYTVPMDETSSERSFDEQVSMLDEAMDRVVARHLPADGRTGLLLSGGRDSRVLAGVLHRQGVRPTALTLGEARDHDVRCAAMVAQTLGFAHTVAQDPLDDVEAMVRHHVAVEQLGNGLANFYTWGMLPLLEPLGSRLLSGHWIEAFVGGIGRRLSRALPSGIPSEHVHREAMSYGIASDRLRHLARPDVFGTAVDDCEERIRAEFADGTEDDDRRSWRFLMSHRARYHSGSTLWRMSFEAWPAVPVLDQRFVQLCLSIPATTLLHRRAQDELLRTRFPSLARLPLDRNSNRIEPLLPSAAWRARRRIVDSVPLAHRVAREIRRRGGERRRYWRLYDINSSMWRVVRRMAEMGRGRVADLFDANELTAVLPPVDVRIDLRDTITDSNGLKALLGFLIWWPEHG